MYGGIPHGNANVWWLGETLDVVATLVLVDALARQLVCHPGADSIHGVLHTSSTSHGLAEVNRSLSWRSPTTQCGHAGL